MTRMTFVGVPTINDIMQKTGNELKPGKNDGIHTENPEAMKACSRRWYENNKERLASSRKYNRKRLNDYWRSYYAKSKEKINQRLLEQRQKTKRMEYHAFWGLGPRI